MKRKAKTAIPDASSAPRLVLRIPLEQLWTSEGPTNHTPLRDLSPDEVESLLKTTPDLRLVEARIAEELRWHPRGDYRFWRDHARNHAAHPDKPQPLDDFPDSMLYFVSEWLDEASQDRILLFELHH